MSRRLARELTIQTLYQQDLYPSAEPLILEEMADPLTEMDRKFHERLLEGVNRHIQTIDQYIQRYIKKGWTIERLATVDRAILRLAVYELLYEPETPTGVVLNEAVELAKTYSGETSSKFINGVLGSLVKDLDEIRSSLSSEDNLES
jgi:N utilization substance protein B